MTPPNRDVPNGGRIFKSERELVKRQPCCKKVGNSIFCDFFLISNNS